MGGALNAKVGIGAVLVAGLALAVVWIVADRGPEVGALLVTGGPSLLVVVPWMALPLLCAALSWRLLFPPGAPRPGFPALYRATWIGLAVNWLLPVAQIGGEIAKARLLIGAGRPATLISASVVADQTLQVVSQILFSLAGFALIMLVVGATAPIEVAGASVLLLGLGTWAFYRIQRRGLFRFFRPVVLKLVPALHRATVTEAGGAVDQALGQIYDRHGRVAAALAWRLAYRVALAGEVWLVMVLIGQPVTLLEALIIETMVQTARNAAFVVPAGLGVQEGALVLVLGALGIGVEPALALAAAKRVRELGVGVPGLLAWQATETTSVWSVVRSRTR